MRRVSSVCRRAGFALATLLVTVVVVAGPASAADPVSSAAQALRTSDLYVDPAAAGVLSASDITATRTALSDSTAPVFVAVVPSTAAAQVGGPDNLPTAIGQQTGRPGIYLVVSDKGVRASSDVLATGEAGSLASSALRAQQPAGRGAVVVAFIRDATAAYSSRSAGPAPPSPAGVRPSTPSTSSGSSSATLLVILGLVVAAAAALWLRGSKRRKARAALDANEYQARKADVSADLTALEQDLMVHDSTSNSSPETPADRSLATAWARYTAAGAALGSAKTPRDLERVTLTVRQGRAAFEDGVALREGRPTAQEVYETVTTNAQQGAVPNPGQRLAAAPDGQPVGSTAVIQNYSTVNYPGYGYGWYPGFGYGYYGYGGGFVSGMLLGELLADNGAWGYGYGGGFGGDGDYGQGYGQDQGGGDWSAANSNGGDWGGGGGSDTGGGADWGGGGGFDTGGGGGGDWGGGGGGFDTGGGGGSW